MLEFACPEATVGVGELEWPQEVGCLLEIWSGSVDFVYEIFDGDDAKLAERLLDDLVIVERDALLVDLAVTTLVDEFADRLQVCLAVGDVRLDKLQHVGGRLGDLDEDTIVDLQQAQELQDLAGFRRNFVDTIRVL